MKLFFNLIVIISFLALLGLAFAGFELAQWLAVFFLYVCAFLTVRKRMRLK